MKKKMLEISSLFNGIHKKLETLRFILRNEKIIINPDWFDKNEGKNFLKMGLA